MKYAKHKNELQEDWSFINNLKTPLNCPKDWEFHIVQDLLI